MATSHLSGNTYEEQDDEEMYDAEMEKTREGYQLKIDVLARDYGAIIGRKGETIRRITEETQTKIHIPKAHERSKKITISGRTREGVSSAKNRIRQQLRKTHFVAIPLNSKEIIDRFQIFQEKVLNECKHCSGVDETIFQYPQKLHLTVVILVLLTKQEVKAAQEILDDCLKSIINPILQGNPLLLDVAGLGCMNDDPGKVNVLYAKAKMQDGTDRLQEMANRIRERFAKSELCQDDRKNEAVMLHLTLMNSSFGAPEGKGKGHRQRREAFDASEILELFGDFSFGEVHVKSLQLAQIGRRAEDGFYWAAGEVPLP